MSLAAKNVATQLLLLLSAVLFVATLIPGTSAQHLSGYESSFVESVPVEEVSFESLLTDVDGSSIRKAVVREGMFQVTQVPRLKTLRKKMFHEMVKCMMTADKVKTAVLADETVRHTFASIIEHGQRYETSMKQHLGISDEELSEECKQFEATSTAVRELVTRVSTMVFAQLDALCGTRTAGEIFARHINGVDHYPSMQSFLTSGSHLEHYHAYQANCSSTKMKSGLAALDLHTDVGLFIALLPSAYYDTSTANEVSAKPGMGFLVESSEGEIGRPALAEEGDVIFFMMGQGMTEFGHKCMPMRPVPHAMVMQPSCELGDNIMRAWYGRMFLQPKSAVNERSKLSYGEEDKIRVAAVTHQKDSFGAGCSYSNEYSSNAQSPHMMARDLATSCGTGEAYCWMSCMEIATGDGCTSSSTADDAVCANSETGEVWELGDSHCTECTLTCPDTLSGNSTSNSSSTSTTTKSGSICNGYGTVMYMSGFQSSIDPDDYCVNILFRKWTLDTRWKMAVGFLGSFAFAIFVEFVIWARRYHLKVLQDRWSTPANYSVYISMYILQVTNGYFAMLIIMTYSAFLFIAVVLGLAAGHVIFNMNLRSTKGQAADPCCQFAEEIDDTPTAAKHKVVQQQDKIEVGEKHSCCAE